MLMFFLSSFPGNNNTDPPFARLGADHLKYIKNCYGETTTFDESLCQSVRSIETKMFTHEGAELEIFTQVDTDIVVICMTPACR